MILGLLSLFLVLFKKYNWLYATGIVSLLIQYNFVMRSQSTEKN